MRRLAYRQSDDRGFTIEGTDLILHWLLNSILLEHATRETPKQVRSFVHHGSCQVLATSEGRNVHTSVAIQHTRLLKHIHRVHSTSSSNLKADSHIACRAHAVPLPCRAAKGLECVFPI
jgi:hypothetical protein